jgi:hypothetical protein
MEIVRNSEILQVFVLMVEVALVELGGIAVERVLHLVLSVVVGHPFPYESVRTIVRPKLAARCVMIPIR